VRTAAYGTRYGDLMRDLDGRLSALVPPDAVADEVAQAIAHVVDLPRGTRPFRVHIDPSRDGSDVVSAVADRIRADFFHRIDLQDLLTPASSR
jgi:hypothetical protein